MLQSINMIDGAVPRDTEMDDTGAVQLLITYASECSCCA
jgi:hypothetical protein